MKKMLIIFSLFSSMAWAQTYKVDPSHASIVFKVSHLGFSNVFGMFSGAEGTFTFDEKNPANSNFTVSVKTDTVFTYDKKRDEHLKGPDFFNAKQFPTITLKSTAVKPKGKNQFDVTADLTLNGETKPVKFVFTRMKTGKDPWGKDRTGGETTFKFKRTDFKMNYMSKPGEIGDEVEMTVSIEGLQQ